MVESPGSARLVGSVIAALVALTACAPGGGTATPTDAAQATSAQETAAQETQEPSALEALTGSRLCDLLPSSAIERELGAKVGQRDGQEPSAVSRECDYETGGFDLATRVRSEPDEQASDDAVLDALFTTDNATTPGEYERVPGLGVAAGYGPDATLAGVNVEGRYLGVVFTLDDERMSLTMHTLGTTELARLRPLAEALLANLEQALR